MKATLYVFLLAGVLCQGVKADGRMQKQIVIDSSSLAKIRAKDSLRNTDWSLLGQYDYLLSRSKNANGYKLVNPYRLASFWKSVSDTLANERKKLNAANAKLSAQTKTISTAQPLSTEETVKLDEAPETNANTTTDKLIFLGMSFTKAGYHTLVWGLILGLTTTLFIVIVRSAKNINEAQHKTELYEELTAEFQKFKSKANEKERKLTRELQDERNLVEELKNNQQS